MISRDTLMSWSGRILLYGFLSMLFIVTFFPFWQIFVLSINDGTDSLRGGFLLWPRDISLESYAAVFSNPEITTSVKVTLLRTLLGVPLSVFCIALLAYVLSKKDLVGSRFVNLFFVFTMYFSGGLIPTYMIVKSLGLIDNFLVFLFPGLINIFWMILIRTFMEELPRELEESAQIDGANDVRIFVKVILPVCVPVLATVALFSAIYHWNAWYDSYIYTYNPDLKTLQAVLVKILNQYQTGDMLNDAQQLANEAKKIPVTGESIRMTVTMVATLPIILVYPFVQRFFLKGMLLGAVKN
ncbi:sugar ABC transporter permease [Cohnella sp. CIP 111063]|uniref:carbohydrate ABC transporter permease n=1 Tax=unclassified Cohnella TaxID=2636738 RepID=UPI000B8C288B|nr:MULTISPECIES: carbohydrate ABC transporter permease [unclassified Cohnella]OXS55544.1 sugar ABC transporter permease [Cohnella sp. CIP 111063]PRX66384.1 carbohydrate ABC transporter membrane protein 2 (CUT1 family) [Cohnella sp. SGD-V74]